MNEEGRLMKNEYKLSIAQFNDTGRVTRPDGSSVEVDKISIERDGEDVRVISFDYAGHTLGLAICSCGKGIEEHELTFNLADGSVFYPAKCCGKAVFFEGDEKNAK